MPALENAAMKLQTVSRKTILCDLIGMSYSMYNKTEYNYIPEQMALNDAIMEINVRNGNGVRGPLIQSYTHKWRHGRLGHRYASTLHDGLHFNNHFKGQIAARIVDTFYRNINATCN